MEIFEEGYRNFDLKPLTEEEVVDFAREYLSKGLKDCTTYRIAPEGTIEVVEMEKK